MAYIGKQPAVAALTASDITDGIISNAKLAQDIISADTALGAEPADTDELLVSDAGVLKRMDYSYIKGGGITMADSWRITANKTVSSGESDINNSSVSAGSAPKAVSAEIISCASLAFVIIPSATSELVKGAAVGFLPI